MRRRENAGRHLAHGRPISNPVIIPVLRPVGTLRSVFTHWPRDICGLRHSTHPSLSGVPRDDSTWRRMIYVFILPPQRGAIRPARPSARVRPDPRTRCPSRPPNP